MVTRIGPRSPQRRRIFFKEWREQAGLTQDQLAERMGTTKATVSRTENGRVQYSQGYVEAMAYAISVEPDQLFRDPARPSADSLLEKASPEQRARAISVIEALLKTG